MKKIASMNGATIAVCTGLVTCALFSCSGDDSAVPVPTADSGTDAARGSDGQSSASGSFSSGSSSASGSFSSGSSSSGGSSSGGSSSGSSSSAISDASTNDALPDSNAGDGFSQTSPDAAPDGGADADASPPPQLEMCESLDALWGIQTDAGGCDTMTSPSCPDRLDAWVADIENAFGGGPATSDCRVFEIFSTVDEGGVLSQDEQDDWIDNTLPAFIFDFFGCPETGVDAGSLASYGVIPSALSTHVFTSADLSLVSAYFSQGIQMAVSDLGAGSLTGDQIAAINARLAYLQTTVSYVDSPRYSFADTCPEAGPDASSDDANADGGSD